MNAEAGGGSGAAAAEPVTPGELLRTQRERRALSVQQAAEDLHLDTWAIEAIEANRFLALGAPVYAKGHLRKYATLLGLSPAFVIARYEALSNTPAEPMPIPASVVSPARPAWRAMRVPPWAIGAILVLALAWLAFELVSLTESEPGLIITEPAVTLAPEPLTAPPAQALPEAPSQAAAASVPVAPPRAQATAVTSSTARVASSARELRLRLEFTEPSWAEVYDANGDRLMFDMGAPGRARTLTGVPPLRVRLGRAAAVRAQVNDRSIEIPQRDGRDSARFLIEADGSVRIDGSKQTISREVAVE